MRLCSPPLHFVLPRDKKERLLRQIGSLEPRRGCAAPGCSAEALTVLLVESEREALLCPRHQLVDLDGRPVEGEPLFAAVGW
jgi:hypothetical protein